MRESDVQEWEEYDARLVDDTSFAQGTLATPRLASEFRQPSIELPAGSESPFLLGNVGEIEAEAKGMSSILQSRFQFIDYPPCAPVHQGTGDIVYSPWLVEPSSVPGSVSRPLEFVTPSCATSVLCMTIDTPQGPNWYGIAYKQNIQSFDSVNIFCHPHPGHAGMNDIDYQSRGGEWRKLFRYAQNLGFQLSAANSTQILVVPFFSNASYSSGGIFTSNWKAILTVIVNGVYAARGLTPEFRSSVNLEVFEQQLREGRTLQHAVQNIVLSSFSFGRTLMGTLRGGMAGLHGVLKEVWDFDGYGGAVPSSSATVRALVYDQAVSNSPPGFHVPKQRWSKFPPAKNSDLHGFIPNMLMWHAATESGVGKVQPIPSGRAQEFETQNQTEALNSAGSEESVAEEAHAEAWPADSLEFDPYADMRAAMSPEHANLAAHEVTMVLGRMPASLVLHQLVNSPEMRQATLASLLGNTGRRSVHLNGSDVSIPAYLRTVSRLCREVAEQREAEFAGAVSSWESDPQRGVLNQGMIVGEVGVLSIDPFPPAISLTHTSNASLNSCENTAATAPAVRDLCSAVADVTGNPERPLYAGNNDNEMVYVGSLAKLYVMYVAFELKSRVQQHAKDMIKGGLSTSTPGWETKVYDDLKNDWQPKLNAAFPGLPSGFPKFANIFVLSQTGEATFAEQSPPLTDADLDAIGEFGTPKGKYRDWMRLLMRWSNNASASKCILPLSYPYINGVLGSADFFDSGAKSGLWLSGDYQGNDWVPGPGNKAGQPLTERWAKLQGRTKSNFTGTAFQVARLLTSIAQGTLVSAAASADMLGTMTGASGIGSYIQSAFWSATPPRPFGSIASKIGYGNDSFSHDCAIVRVDRNADPGKTFRFVKVVLGSPPAKNRTDLNQLAVANYDCIATIDP